MVAKRIAMLVMTMALIFTSACANKTTTEEQTKEKENHLKQAKMTDLVTERTEFLKLPNIYQK